MAPLNTDAITQETEKLDLQNLARTKGPYVIFPENKVNIIRFIMHIIVL